MFGVDVKVHVTASLADLHVVTRGGASPLGDVTGPPGLREVVNRDRLLRVPDHGPFVSATAADGNLLARVVRRLLTLVPVLVVRIDAAEAVTSRASQLPSARLPYSADLFRAEPAIPVNTRSAQCATPPCPTTACTHVCVTPGPSPWLRARTLSNASRAKGTPRRARTQTQCGTKRSGERLQLGHPCHAGRAAVGRLGSLQPTWRGCEEVEPVVGSVAARLLPEVRLLKGGARHERSCAARPRHPPRAIARSPSRPQAGRARSRPPSRPGPRTYAGSRA